MIVPYEVSHTVGIMPPGVYRLIVVETDTRDSSTVYDQRNLDFVVRDSCGPVETCVLPGFAPGENGCNATVSLSTPGFLNITLSNRIPIAGAEIVVDGFQQLSSLPCGQGIECDWRLSVTKVEPVMRAADMGLEWTFKDGRLHLMLQPLSILDNQPSLGVIEPGEGPVARITLQLLSDTLTPSLPISEGNITVTLNPVAFADEQGLPVPPCPTFATLAGTICIRNEARCDINADGRSDVVDIVNMIKCIMCTIPEGCCSADQVSRADCNVDGVLNVTDVVCCIRRILDSFCSWCKGTDYLSQGSTGHASVGFSQDISWESDTHFTVPIAFSSPTETGGVEIRIAYDPSVLSVDKVTGLTELDGTELYYKAADGELAFMVVALGSNPLPMGEAGLLAKVSFAYVSGSSRHNTEIVMEGAAGADKSGNRLDLLLTNDRAAIEPTIAPAVRLASKPNPFLSSTEVSLSIPSAQDGSLAIYDVAGRLVRILHQGHFSEGPQSFTWDGRGNSGVQVRSGVYFVRFDGRVTNLVSKLVLLKRQ